MHFVLARYYWKENFLKGLGRCLTEQLSVEQNGVFTGCNQKLVIFELCRIQQKIENTHIQLLLCLIFLLKFSCTELLTVVVFCEVARSCFK